MDLQQLQARRQELETAITTTGNSLYILRGHMQEVEYQIGLLEEAAKLAAEAALANPPSEPVE